MKWMIFLFAALVCGITSRCEQQLSALGYRIDSSITKPICGGAIPIENVTIRDFSLEDELLPDGLQSRNLECGQGAVQPRICVGCGLRANNSWRSTDSVGKSKIMFLADQANSHFAKMPYIISWSRAEVLNGSGPNRASSFSGDWSAWMGGAVVDAGSLHHDVGPQLCARCAGLLKADPNQAASYDCQENRGKRGDSVLENEDKFIGTAAIDGGGDDYILYRGLLVIGCLCAIFAYTRLKGP